MDADTRAARPLVLVAEDHDDTREMLHTLLTLNGFDVVDCADGSTAVGEAARLHPDVIVLNGSLPSVDGLSAAREICRATPDRAGRIVVMTGQASEDLRRQALGAGCDQIFLTPLDIDRLVETVRRLAHGQPYHPRVQ